MSEYKRLTERDEYGNADIIGLSTEKLFGELYFDEINLLTNALNKLAFLEDKIENGTLVEFNKPFYSNQLNAWCIYLREGDYITSLCLTKEQAEEYQKKIAGGTEMKSVLISIQPKWVEKICHEIGKDENGKAIYEKRIEVRKTAPKEVPFKAYIYCTIGNGVKGDYLVPSGIQCGKVIGEFVCDKVIRTCGWRLRGDTQQCAKRTVAETELPKLACLTIDEIVDYAGSENREVVGWHISELKIYDKPKELYELNRPCPDKFHYCDICKYGSVVLSSDEEEYALYHGGHYDTYETVCHNIVTRPPQSWCYIEEQGDAK